MPKKEYLSHPITKEWRADVRAELDKRGRGSQARLAEFVNKRGIKISTGHLADILKGEYDTSDIVEPVHEFFGWAPPLPPTASRDASELVHGWMRLTPEQRAKIISGAQKVGELSGDQARDLLAQLLGGKSDT